jgi:hypothetical protein
MKPARASWPWSSSTGDPVQRGLPSACRGSIGGRRARRVGGEQIMAARPNRRAIPPRRVFVVRIPDLRAAKLRLRQIVFRISAGAADATPARPRRRAAAGR